MRFFRRCSSAAADRRAGYHSLDEQGAIHLRDRHPAELRAVCSGGTPSPGLQIDVDATAMVQAGLGSGYAQQIITTEIADFLSHSEGVPLSTVNLDVRIAFNPNMTTAWFTSVMGIINNITMLAIILAGAAIVREREHGTMDHLLVMPLTPFEIAMSKVWANGLVITVAVGLSLYFVVRMMLGIPIAGSIPLFMVGVVIYLFFATAIGIFWARWRGPCRSSGCSTCWSICR
jgi:ABC-2 type transport system permease protein